MKKFKITIFGLLFLMFGATVFLACSSEEETMIDTKANLRTFSPEEFGELRAIVDVFYEEEVTFDIGRTATVNEEEARYDCTEIIFAGHERARGYLVSDHTTGEFLYLADVDRTNYVLKTLDIANAERETIRDINLHPDYESSGEFDFIQIIGDIGYEVSGGIGWLWENIIICPGGMEAVQSHTEYFEETGGSETNCTRSDCYKSRTRFGIDIGDKGLGNIPVNCSTGEPL